MDKQLSFLPAQRSAAQPNAPESSVAEKQSSKPTTPSTSPVIWKLYIDGAARGNPGAGGAGIYITSDTGDLFKEGFYLGKMTNNQAEYLALAIGLFFVKKLMIKHEVSLPIIHVYSDSELLIKQMQGIYKIRNIHLLNLKEYIEQQMIDLKCRFTHIRRELNKTADAMANEGIDKKKRLPITFLKLVQRIISSGE